MQSEVTDEIVNLSERYVASLLSCNPLPSCVTEKKPLENNPIQVQIGDRTEMLTLDFSHFDPKKSPHENAREIVRSRFLQKFKDGISRLVHETNPFILAIRV